MSPPIQTHSIRWQVNEIISDAGTGLPQPEKKKSMSEIIALVNLTTWVGAGGRMAERKRTATPIEQSFHSTPKHC